ncbi:hypothetical protein [Flavobacterium sp.]|uniref:hypothetical protein n=1 Tax=Flavobacterium sp. TaxID=239 RepID=UPI002B4B24F7|nr:hypothetical protein [Flavobacterium sp.]HLF52909.1 hypothetical protein [Flavobacterium sp.]
MDHTIKLFLKLGSEENILDLFENGTIYMNTIEYFRKVEDEDLRGDKYEGVSKIINSLPGTFKIPGIDREFKYEKMHIREVHEEIIGNIYSLYAISSKGFPNPLDFKFDERNLRFGTHCLLIKNLPYFFDRIETELKNNNYKFNHGFVDYYDKDEVNREITLFEKPFEFEYQKEFRFYVEDYGMKPIKIQIGSLKKYAVVFKLEDMLELKLEPKE